MELSGMSTMVVMPPAAAARVALAKPSHSVRPGSLTWTWVSTSPGRMTRSPASSSGTPAGTSAWPARSTITPRPMWIEAGRTPSSIITRRLRTTRSATIRASLTGRWRAVVASGADGAGYVPPHLHRQPGRGGGADRADLRRARHRAGLRPVGGGSRRALRPRSPLGRDRSGPGQPVVSRSGSSGQGRGPDPLLGAAPRLGLSVREPGLRGLVPATRCYLHRPARPRHATDGQE